MFGSFPEKGRWGSWQLLILYFWILGSAQPLTVFACFLLQGLVSPNSRTAGSLVKSKCHKVPWVLDRQLPSFRLESDSAVLQKPFVPVVSDKCKENLLWYCYRWTIFPLISCWEFTKIMVFLRGITSVNGTGNSGNVAIFPRVRPLCKVEKKERGKCEWSNEKYSTY